jgi:hypothetical protein
LLHLRYIWIIEIQIHKGAALRHDIDVGEDDGEEAVEEFTGLQDAEHERDHCVRVVTDIAIQLQVDRSPAGDARGSEDYERWARGARRVKSRTEQRIATVNRWIRDWHRQRESALVGSSDLEEKVKATAFAAADALRKLRAEKADLLIENANLRRRAGLAS